MKAEGSQSHSAENRSSELLPEASLRRAPSSLCRDRRCHSPFSQGNSAQNSEYRFQRLFHSKPGGLEARSADRPKPCCADFFRREDRMWRENPATRLKVASRNAFPAVPEGLSVFLILSGKTAFSAAINHCCFCTLSNQRTGKNAQKNPAYAICSRFLGAEIRIGV